VHFIAMMKLLFASIVLMGSHGHMTGVHFRLVVRMECGWSVKVCFPSSFLTSYTCNVLQEMIAWLSTLVVMVIIALSSVCCNLDAKYN
jgi:hypothetical protein